MLLRSDKAPADAAAARAEVVRILATGVQAGSLPADDRANLAQIVVPPAPACRRRTPQSASTRSTTRSARPRQTARAKEAADIARKATAGAALWITVALLLGTFVASMAATFGGKLRDGVAAPQSPRNR